MSQLRGTVGDEWNAGSVETPPDERDWRPVVSERVITRALRRALFDDAVSVIARDYGAALTLDGVASEIATSRRQLQRVFAAVGNTTFRSYLTAVRMRKAAELLAGDPTLSVRHVARCVGYQQPPQFAKAFRRVHGIAPAEFRTAARRSAPDAVLPA